MEANQILAIEIDSTINLIHTVNTPNKRTLACLMGGVSHIHSRTYTKYLTEQERRARPHEGDARSDYDEPYLKWESAIESRLGFKRPADFRDLISKIPFELIERLPCEEFPE